MKPIDIMDMWLMLTVRDGQGRVVEHRCLPSRSPVRAILEAILSMVIATDVATIDVGGAADNVGPSDAGLLDSTGPVNDDTQGIVVGTGVTAVDIADNALATKIAHGTGSGQLSYAAQTMDSQVEAGIGLYKFNVSRAFTNNSGATIKVFECGLYGLNGQAGGASDDICLIRDVVTPLYLAPGMTATVAYQVHIRL